MGQIFSSFCSCGARHLFFANWQFFVWIRHSSQISSNCLPQAQFAFISMEAKLSNFQVMRYINHQIRERISFHGSGIAGIHHILFRNYASICGGVEQYWCSVQTLILLRLCSVVLLFLITNVKYTCLFAFNVFWLRWVWQEKCKNRHRTNACKYWSHLSCTDSD